MEWNREILQKPMWKEEIKNREAKEQIAQRIAGRVQDGSWLQGSFRMFFQIRYPGQE